MSWVVKSVLAIAAIVALALTIRWLGGKRNEDETVKIPPETQARIDSLELTADSAAAFRQRNRELADSVIALGAAIRRRAAPQRSSAVGAGITADSAAVLAQRAATAQDSATLWHVAYDARTRQVTALETVVAAQDSAAAQDSIAIATLQRGWSLDIERLALETQTRRELQAAITRANECRILWLVDCPTRGQAVIGGIVLGTAAAIWGDDLVRAVKP